MFTQDYQDVLTQKPNAETYTGLELTVTTNEIHETCHSITFYFMSELIF